MATTKIPWGDSTGGNIVLTYTGVGSGSLSISSDTPNEGLDREKTITLQTTNPGDKVTVSLTVRQSGRRIELCDSSGMVLLTSDSQTLNVLK